MSEDRKYKQRGYREYESRPQAGPPSPSGIDGRRLPVITAVKESVRCDNCGASLSPHFEIGNDSRCPKCGGDLHTCRHCFHFDPSARYECSRPVKERVESKQSANSCEMFEVRLTRSREVTYGASPRPEDAKRALDNLFRKK